VIGRAGEGYLAGRRIRDIDVVSYTLEIRNSRVDPDKHETGLACQNVAEIIPQHFRKGEAETNKSQIVRRGKGWEIYGDWAASRVFCLFFFF
jgi:hypothetical protein